MHALWALGRGPWEASEITLRAALGFSRPWQGPMPLGDVGGQVLGYQATE